MKNRNYLLAYCLTILLVCLLAISCTRTPVIYLVGDSTMSYKPDSTIPERGWGMLLPEYFDESVFISNHAMNGRSSRSFIYEGRLDSVYSLLKKGDYIVYQFGHNDKKTKSPERYCAPEEYRYYMSKFVRDTREKGANPILCTSIERRKFDSLGQLINTHEVYPEITREVARELNVPLVDMQKMSHELIMNYGVEESKILFLHFPPGEISAWPDGRADNTHFSELGARKMAGLFVKGLKDMNHELTKYLKKNEDED